MFVILLSERSSINVERATKSVWFLDGKGSCLRSVFSNCVFSSFSVLFRLYRYYEILPPSYNTDVVGIIMLIYCALR